MYKDRMNMNLAAYIAFALLAGSVAGASLGYLLNAPRKKSSELRQWAALAAAMLVVISCAIVMKTVGEIGTLSTLAKVSASLAFFLSFAAIILYCRVKL
jgi:L-cystine uptake protein TcyP (sodium:dicarboxylate symporter family)